MSYKFARLFADAYAASQNGYTYRRLVEDVATEGLTYQLSSDGKYYICTGPDTISGDIRIADAVNGILVTHIDTGAFAGDTNITSVTIPDSITTIGQNAFNNCTNLKSVNIPNSVTTINIGAFSGCRSLNLVYFNADAMNDLTSDNRVFRETGRLGGHLRVIVGKNVTRIPSYLFYDSYDDKRPWVGSVEFEEDSICTSIGPWAFYNCTELANIKLGDSLQTIEARAFYSCTSLTDVTIPDSIITIGTYAFHNCTNIKTVTLGNNLQVIGNGAFASCLQLANVTIPKSVTTIEANAFSSCSSITDVTIPYGVTYLGDSAFGGCGNLVNVSIPYTVVRMGKSVLNNCPKLASVVIDTRGVWYYTTDEWGMQTMIGGWELDVSDSSANAEYFKKSNIYYFYKLNSTIRGYASGEMVLLTDVSPEEHNIEVKVKSKNLADIYGFSTECIQNVNYNRFLSNEFGTTLSTTNAANSIEVTQTKSPNANPISYENGYFCIGIHNNFQDGDIVTVSFDVEITSNPLNATEGFVMSNGLSAERFELKNGRCSATLTWGNYNDRKFIEIRNAGCSAVFSNFQVELGAAATPYTQYLETVDGVVLTPKSRNLFDISKVITSGEVVNNGDGTITVGGNGGMYSGGTLQYFCPELKVGDVFTLTLRNITNVVDTKEGSYIYIGAPCDKVLNSYGTYTATEDMLNGTVLLYKAPYAYQSQVETGIVTEIQVELGTTATPYTPYIANPEAVKILVQGKNLLSLDKFSWSSNCTLENGVVTQTNADTNPNPVFKIAGNGYAELARSGVISNGRLSLEFVCTEKTDNLYFGVHGNSTDTCLYFAGVNLRAGTYTFSCEITNATQGSISWKDMQLEVGTSATEYEPYKELIQYSQGEYIRSLYPSTLLMADTPGAILNVAYNTDKIPEDPTVVSEE